MVYIEIRDTDNSITGRLDVGNSDEFPLILNREVSDYQVINKRSGVYSLDFEIPLSESNISLLKGIDNANLKDYKQLFKRKKAIIFNDEIYIAEGLIQVKSISLKNEITYLKCVFFGDNLEWVTELNELTLSEIDFVDSTFDFTYNTIINSWTNTADTNDFVFPYIDYGEINRYTPVATRVEEYRPALFVKRILDTAFNQIGYNLSSTFFDTSSFKGLILPYFSDLEEDRWINTDNLVNTYYTSTRKSADSDIILPATGRYYNLNGSISYSCEATPANRAIPLNTKSGNNSAVYNTTTYTYSGFTYFGQYSFNYNIDCASKFVTDSNAELRLYFYNSRTGKHLINKTSISAPEIMKGTFYADIQSGDSLIVYLDYYLFSTTNVTSTTSQDCNIQRPSSIITVKSSSYVNSSITKTITYGKKITLSNVLSNSYTVLTLINDLSRMFNLFWKTNNTTKTVSVEPRDDFYNGISSAVDLTEFLNIDKGYNLIDTKSELSRYYSFNYLDDDNDAITSYYNSQAQKSNTYKLGSYYKYDLGSDYADSEELNITSSVSYSIVRPLEYVYINAYTARLWQENTYLPPSFSTKFNPRILNYVYGEQSLQVLNESFNGVIIPNALLRIQDPSQSYGSDPLLYGTKFKTFGFALNQSLYDVNGGLISSAPMNLDYKDSRDSQVGLLNTYYKGLLNSLKNGKSLECYLSLDNTTFKTLNLFSPIYFSAPEEIQGYWLIEGIYDYKVGNENNIVKLKLLKFSNIEPLNATTTNSNGDLEEYVAIRGERITLANAGYGGGTTGNGLSI